jgi:hypothetical protein
MANRMQLIKRYLLRFKAVELCAFDDVVSGLTRGNHARVKATDVPHCVGRTLLSAAFLTWAIFKSCLLPCGLGSNQARKQDSASKAADKSVRPTQLFV